MLVKRKPGQAIAVPIYISYLYNKDERLSVCVSVCLCLCPFMPGKTIGLTCKQNIHSYVNNSGENNGQGPNSLISILGGAQGGSAPLRK